ncbi:hypothetical protein [uncultured Methanobrevibacter sp.]|uniref:hypothetical protein n=1 Tax=uncultured Methanobrevibacter sp. TaxID=253161 RepID=UPI002608A015|nr:hypothetical protein [uncultured Methanobrevibacter sp.]
MNAVYDYGQRQKKEGKIEGKKEICEKMAIYMIKNGETDEKIQKETELTPEEIKKIRNEQKNV